MTTITLNENIWFINKTFQNVDDLIEALIKIKPWILEEENFSIEEEKVIKNRNQKIKKLENDISSLLI